MGARRWSSVCYQYPAPRAVLQAVVTLFVAKHWHTGHWHSSNSQISVSIPCCSSSLHLCNLWWSDWPGSDGRQSGSVPRTEHGGSSSREFLHARYPCILACLGIAFKGHHHTITLQTRHQLLYKMWTCQRKIQGKAMKEEAVIRPCISRAARELRYWWAEKSGWSRLRSNWAFPCP